MNAWLAFDMGGGFVPFRRRVRYVAAREVPLEAVKDRLQLCASPRWSMSLRRGHMRLTDEDAHHRDSDGCTRAVRHGCPVKKTTGAPPPLPSRLPGPGSSPGFLLWKVSNAWQRRQRAALEPFGLTHSQFVLLATATWFGASETLTQARLAELSGVDPMTTSQVLRALEGALLVQRRGHPDDPRAKAIVVTEAGRAKARKAVVVVEETDAAFFAPLAPQTPQLIEMFGALVAAEAARAATPREPKSKQR